MLIPGVVVKPDVSGIATEVVVGGLSVPSHVPVLSVMVVPAGIVAETSLADVVDVKDVGPDEDVVATPPLAVKLTGSSDKKLLQASWAHHGAKVTPPLIKALGLAVDPHQLLLALRLPISVLLTALLVLPVMLLLLMTMFLPVTSQFDTNAPVLSSKTDRVLIASNEFVKVFPETVMLVMSGLN